MIAAAERRQHVRTPVARPCKAFHRASRTYIAGRTGDLSAGGALIFIESTRPLMEGEELDLVVAWDRRAVLPADSLRRARVVRIGPGLEGRRAVGIRFVEEHAAAIAA